MRYERRRIDVRFVERFDYTTAERWVSVTDSNYRSIRLYTTALHIEMENT